MKQKQSTPHPHTPLSLTSAEASAISCAMDFLLHYDNYVYNTSRFDCNDASRAAWNVDSGKFPGNRRELRAALAAIDLSVLSLKGGSEALDMVSKVFPDLIPDLSDSLSVLESLRPRLAAHAAKWAQKR